MLEGKAVRTLLPMPINCISTIDQNCVHFYSACIIVMIRLVSQMSKSSPFALTSSSYLGNNTKFMFRLKKNKRKSNATAEKRTSKFVTTVCKFWHKKCLKILTLS